MADRSLGHRAPLLWLVLPYALGLAWGKVGSAPSPALGLALALPAAVAALVLAGRHPRLWPWLIGLAIALCSTASYQLHRNRLPDWERLPPREAQLQLRILRVFATGFEERTSGLAEVTHAAPHLQDLVGQKIYYALRLGPGEEAPVRSAELTAQGVLTLLPRNPADDTFDGYLADAGMNFKLTRGRVIETVAPATAYRAFCARMEAQFVHRLSHGIEAKQPELTNVLRAMMLGRKHDLSEEQDTLFMQSGTMHLFAISGLHIGVIAGGVQALLLLLRLPRVWRYWLSLLLLWLYVDITGGTPSAVRAFCMVALVQTSFMWRVPGNPLAALAASAGIVLLLEPMQLFSASFQMSYGIVVALLTLGLPLAGRWQARWPLFASLPVGAWRWWQHLVRDGWNGLLVALAIGVASILVSSLCGVQFFNLFTPGALIANVVLIPIAMVVILAGMGSLLCGLVGFGAGSVLCNHAAVLVLWLIDRALRLLVDLPGIYHAAAYQAAWIGPLGLALLLASLLYGYHHGWSRRHGAWWPPCVIVALTLIFGVNFA